MKRIVTTAIVLSIALSYVGVESAEAGRRTRSARRVRLIQRNNNGPGFFSRMMEVERRKNAWLRATFLNR